MKLSAIIKALMKNTLISLTTYDIDSHELNTKKRKAKQKCFLNALKTATHLKELKLIDYTPSTHHQPIVTLDKLLSALIDNASLELLDVSHNHIDEATNEALVHLLGQAKLPLKQVFLDYLNYGHPVENLPEILRSLVEKNTLTTLSLHSHCLNHTSCESLLTLLLNKESSLQKLDLSHCSLALTDLEKIQAATLARGKKFSLIIDQVEITNSITQKNMETNHASFTQVKPLNFFKAPIRLVKSDGDANLTQNYRPLFAPAPIAPSEEISPFFTLPKSQSETDINSCREKAMKLKFN